MPRRRCIAQSEKQGSSKEAALIDFRFYSTPRTAALPSWCSILCLPNSFSIVSTRIPLEERLVQQATFPVIFCSFDLLNTILIDSRLDMDKTKPSHVSRGFGRLPLLAKPSNMKRSDIRRLCIGTERFEQVQDRSEAD